MSQKVGLDDKLYRNTGTYGTPVWAELTLVQDLNLNLETDKAEAKSRASNFKMTKPTHTSGPLEFKILDDAANTDRLAIQTAFTGRTVLDLAVADGLIATAGTEYWRADYYIYGWKKGQPLGEFNTVDVSADLAISSNAQGFTTVGS